MVVVMDTLQAAVAGHPEAAAIRPVTAAGEAGIKRIHIPEANLKCNFVYNKMK